MPPLPGLAFPWLPFGLAGVCDDGFCESTGPLGARGTVDDVVPGVVGCAGTVGAGDGHDSDTFTTPSLTGKEIDDNGVPAGTESDNTCPPNNVTLTTHESAAASPCPTPAPTPTAASASAPARQPRHIALLPIVPTSYVQPPRGATLPTE